jgi:hypothetical protein
MQTANEFHSNYLFEGYTTTLLREQSETSFSSLADYKKYDLIQFLPLFELSDVIMLFNEIVDQERIGIDLLQFIYDLRIKLVISRPYFRYFFRIQEYVLVIHQYDYICLELLSDNTHVIVCFHTDFQHPYFLYRKLGQSWMIKDTVRKIDYQNLNGQRAYKFNHSGITVLLQSVDDKISIASDGNYQPFIQRYLDFFARHPSLDDFDMRYQVSKLTV